MLTNQNILQGGHIWEKANILVGARDAKVCNLVRSQAVNGNSFEGDFSFVDLSKTKLFEGPYLHAEVGSQKLTMTYKNKKRVLDFKTLTIRE